MSRRKLKEFLPKCLKPWTCKTRLNYRRKQTKTNENKHTRNRTRNANGIMRERWTVNSITLEIYVKQRCQRKNKRIHPPPPFSSQKKKLLFKKKLLEKPFYDVFFLFQNTWYAANEIDKQNTNAEMRFSVDEKNPNQKQENAEWILNFPVLVIAIP